MDFAIKKELTLGETIKINPSTIVKNAEVLEKLYICLSAYISTTYYLKIMPEDQIMKFQKINWILNGKKKK